MRIRREPLREVPPFPRVEPIRRGIKTGTCERHPILSAGLRLLRQKRVGECSDRSRVDTFEDSCAGRSCME